MKTKYRLYIALLYGSYTIPVMFSYCFIGSRRKPRLLCLFCRPAGLFSRRQWRCAGFAAILDAADKPDTPEHREAAHMTNAEIVCRFFKEGYENRNYDAVLACLAEDYVDHSPAGARGNRQAVGILQIVAGQFSELSVEMLDLFSENDMVATRVRYEGIHSGTCMGVPATGKRIRFEALENFRVAGGRIVESWGYWPDREIEEKLRQNGAD